MIEKVIVEVSKFIEGEWYSQKTSFNGLSDAMDFIKNKKFSNCKLYIIYSK